jgi:hypothetical protein
MFIEPLPQKAEPYKCSDARDEDGQPMTGKPDTIFALP